MLVDNNRLKQLLNALLTPYGFKKKSNAWYSASDKVVSVVYLQKSSFSNLYYVCISSHFQELEFKQFPKEHECHIRTRLDNELVGFPVDYDYLFDLEREHADNEEYHQALSTCVAKIILPQSNLLKTGEGFLSIVEKQPALLNIVPLDVKRYLGVG